MLLRNERNTLPIRGRTPIYVAGSNADNIGNQAGGWTLTWQGGSGAFHTIPGTTILGGIEQQARGPVTFSQDASAPIPHDAVGVVVVGETPYSEGFGDVGGPQWAYDPDDTGPRPPKTMILSATDSQAIDHVCAQARRCVVVIVSGRPMIIDPAQLQHMDGLVAAWLPGSEGAGIADDLFGAHAFAGQLPVSWPRTLSQEPINIGDRNYDPLYPTATA